MAMSARPFLPLALGALRGHMLLQETPHVHPVRITASACLEADLVSARTDTANLASAILSLARYAQAARSSTVILALQDTPTVYPPEAATRALL